MKSNEEGKKRQKLGFEDTELRLGLPNANANDGKREINVDLKLNLGVNHILSDLQPMDLHNDATKTPPKAHVVGWPPVGSFRKNMIAAQKGGDSKETGKGSDAAGAAAFVKVSMDGAPYLRKVDLKMYKSYQELSVAVGKMFAFFIVGKCDTQGMDFMNESKLKDLSSNSDYVSTYEDKDGDWMLVGDVPWRMFVDSCKRLRIIKGTEAKGLGSLVPRAMEQ